jgi:hypothetical protein
MVSAYSKLPDVNYAISGAKWLFKFIDMFHGANPTEGVCRCKAILRTISLHILKLLNMFLVF